MSVVWHRSGSRRAALVLALTAALTVLQCQPGQEPPQQPPKIAFLATTHDFGSVEQGTPVVAEFSFRNSGGADLIISGLKAGCECTVALAARVIPPGATGSVRATFDTARLFGGQRRSVTVYSNDPAQPFATLTMTGEVSADVAVDPPDLYLGRLRRGEHAENQARIIAGRPLALKLAPAGRVLTASLLPAAQDFSRTLAVAIQPDAPLGRFSETVTIVTSSRQRPTLAVTVVGVVDGEEE